ncbi:hypothetical protein [Mammaliicoccus sciuri]|uniref:hypothetical protein n=1 Tax=Mammaliicoccus sciuri TaxID=1296 RepID=UPI003F56CD78
MIIITILFVLFLSSATISVIIFNKEDFNKIKWIQKVNSYIFPILSGIFLILLLGFYSGEEHSKRFESTIDSDYDNSSYEDTEYEDTDFTVNEPEEVTLYTGVHIGGADIVAGSYIASTTSNSGGNLFVYDDSHFLAYHEFYESGYSENKEGSPVYIVDGSEIKITGVSSVTFTPIGN